MYTPGLRELLHLEHATFGQWLVSLGLAVSLFLASEVHKVWLRRRLGA
jgi:hypothetical protein